MPAQLLTKLRTWISSKTTEQDRHDTAPLPEEVAVSMMALQHQHQEQEMCQEVEHLQQEEKQRHPQEQEQLEQQQQQQQHHHQQQQQHVHRELKQHQEEKKQKQLEEQKAHQGVKHHQEEEEEEEEKQQQQQQQRRRRRQQQQHHHQQQQQQQQTQSEEVTELCPKAASRHNNSSKEESVAESDSAINSAEYQNTPHHRRPDDQTPPRTSDSTKHAQDCCNSPNPSLQQSRAEDSDKTSHLEEESFLTSGYDTMTPSPSLTSEVQEDHAEPEMSSMSQTDTSSISPESLCSADPPHEKHSSADDCLCKESIPFFCSCSRYPTVIHKPGDTPEGEDKVMDNPAEEGQATTAVCRRIPEHVVLQAVPRKDMEDVQEEEEGEQEEEEERGRQEVEEMFPQTALTTPIGALRKSRRRLCLMLNIEMTFREETGLCADYRGLADLVGFEALEIDNFWERNPSDSLFLEWVRSRDSRLQPAVLNSLVSCLLQLDRRDVLEDCRGLILEDVSDYLAEQQFLITHSAGRLTNYDCYVNIADADILTVGREIVDTLEGVYGLRLCLTLRDVQTGDWLYESMAATLETRCNGKVLLVLTKNYEDSEACQFLMNFAAALDPRARQKKLIPLLVDDDAFVPRILRGFSRLNFKRDKELGFLWPRLKHAITG